MRTRKTKSCALSRRALSKKQEDIPAGNQLSYARQDWPLTTDQLRHVISMGETTLVEFKRTWWGAAAGDDAKAKIARAVLAIANTVGIHELGLVVIGIEDERHGGGIRGVIEPPQPEAISQILGTYIHPPVSIQSRHFNLDGVLVSAIAVFHSRDRPHYTLREHPQVLNKRDVYVRRDRQVGVLTLPELERMIREKAPDRSPGELGSDPLQCGFGGADGSYPPTLLFKIENVIAETVADVSVFYDACLLRDPRVCSRNGLLGRAALRPGESRELKINLDALQLWRTVYVDGSARVAMSLHQVESYVSDRWVNLTVYVNFRDSDGLIQQRVIRHACFW